MQLAAATRLGPYEIVAPLGAGGMGEVYRARDTRLGRDVALKVLPISRYGDPALLARFEREAQALATLNHPHIAAIYDVLDVGDHRAIVMELVAGSTLAQVIARGPVPLRDAIAWGIDITDALSVAHAAGIVHRDLKPANVIITDNGSAKVLDFGIAKLGTVTESVDQSTMAALTQDKGLIGTIGYMSPEQAHGRPVDARSDIFNLGVVLHETISGRPAFQGDTAAAVLAAVVRDDPPLLRTLVPITPRAFERCVTRCLEKDPSRRYQHAADLKAALEDLREDLFAAESGTASGSSTRLAITPATVTQRLLRAVAYAAGVLIIAGAGFVAANLWRTPDVITPRYRPFITETTSVNALAYSPDGRTLAYVDVVDGQRHIFVRGIDAAQSTQVTKEPVGGGLPFWSPDGSRIYFVRASDSNLVSVSAGGGEPQVVVSSIEPGAESRVGGPLGGMTASISPDGRTIVFARGQVGGARLWALDTKSGAARPIEAAGMPKPLVIVQALAFSPDGRAVAILASTTAGNQSRGIWLMSWPDGTTRHVAPDASYLASTSSISWMPDSRRVVLNGYPLHGGTSRLLLADTVTGTFRALTGGKDSEGNPSVSPDGSRIAFVSRRPGMDLIQFPLDGSAPEPLLATSRAEFQPDMSASGVLAYVTDADGYAAVRIRSGSAWTRTVGGSEEAERPTQPNNVRMSPDGQRVAVDSYAAEHLIWIYPMAGGTPVRLDPESH